MTMAMHLALSGNDFRALVSGKIVTCKSDDLVVKIILADIGFAVMREAIDEAEKAVAENSTPSDA